MVKNGASVEAHQWSAATESWTKIGDVVNAVSQSQKQTYEGIEYDYVFDVDVQEGAPPLKLPYNVSENPYAAAQRFLEKNGLEMGYIDQVVKFIEQNTGGVQLGTGSGAVDPYCISPQPLPPRLHHLKNAFLLTTQRPHGTSPEQHQDMLLIPRCRHPNLRPLHKPRPENTSHINPISRSNKAICP